MLIALLCVSGANAATILRGASVAKRVADTSQEEHGANLGKITDFAEKIKKVQQSPAAQQAEHDTNVSWIQRVVFQLFFGILYYFLIVTKYPKLDGAKPTPESVELQQLDAVQATLHTSVPNCLLSWCCTGPRAAHTFHSVGVLDYWYGCVLMSLFPCCTLWATNSFTDLNERLGGEKENMFKGLFCAFCCSCCVVAQDAQSLDLMMGLETGFFGVDVHQSLKEVDVDTCGHKEEVTAEKVSSRQVSN